MGLSSIAWQWSFPVLSVTNPTLDMAGQITVLLSGSFWFSALSNNVKYFVSANIIATSRSSYKMHVWCQTDLRLVRLVLVWCETDLRLVRLVLVWYETDVRLMRGWCEAGVRLIGMMQEADVRLTLYSFETDLWRILGWCEDDVRLMLGWRYIHVKLIFDGY